MTNKKWWTRGKLPFKETKINFTRLLRVNTLALSKNTAGYFLFKRNLILFCTSPGVISERLKHPRALPSTDSKIRIQRSTISKEHSAHKPRKHSLGIQIPRKHFDLEKILTDQQFHWKSSNGLLYFMFVRTNSDEAAIKAVSNKY